MSGGTLSGTVWDWHHDGSNKDCTVEFTSDNKVKWSNGQPQGFWKVEGNIITTTFNGVDHQLKVNGDGNEAQLLTPKRNPPSKMTKQGMPYLPTFKESKTEFQKFRSEKSFNKTSKVRKSLVRVS